MKNVLSLFESRINDIFAHGGAGSAPITFKKLAKKTIREMENETFVIDGVDTAPALYTVLVSADDDRTMRPFYANITAEISSLVEAQAKKRGYTFVGQPLVRFMIDPSLKPGKYAVFAENVDPLTLARLREEENAFLGIEPQPQQKPQPSTTQEASSAEDGFTIIPEDSFSVSEPAEGVAAPEAHANAEAQPEEMPPARQVQPKASEHAPEAPEPQEEPSPADESLSPKEAKTPEAAPAHAEQPESPTVEQEGSSNEPVQQRAQDLQPEPKPAPSCTLTDQQTGKVYTITSERTPIGREHVPGGIVLRDPNVSRHHAELVYDGGEWHIHDLNSTNGTLVNDIDVEECALRDGDVLTIGLLNLVFREH